MMYEPRYCAFIDILGFRSLMSALRADTSKFEVVRRSLTKIHQPVSFAAAYPQLGFRAQSVSDAVAISVAAIEGKALAILQICLSVERLAIELLKEGYFIRGAITKGLLYHDENMVFGDALIRAYDLEINVVNFPRVMVTRDVLTDIKQDKDDTFDVSDLFLNMFVQASDGPHFVHVLRTPAMTVEKIQINNLSKRREEQESLKEFEGMRDAVQTRLDEAVDNPRHYEKVKWFAEYWNSSVPFLQVGIPGPTSWLGPIPSSYGEHEEIP